MLTDSVFANVRRQAGADYQAIVESAPQMKMDNTFYEEMIELSGANGAAARDFPGLVDNKAIESVATQLFDTDKFSPRGGLDMVKRLRFDANAHLKALGDPEKHALGLAERSAADSLDDLMERNLTAVGEPGMVDRYRAARKLIAKSYDLEGATNTETGEVNAHALAGMYAKGRPFEGEMEKIARVATSFPKATQRPSAFGGDEKLSGLDYYAMLGAAIAGHPLLGLVPLARPLSRATALSQGFQNRMTRSPKPASSLPMPLNETAGRATLPLLSVDSAEAQQ